jgi:hypothetical protein
MTQSVPYCEKIATGAKCMGAQLCALGVGYGHRYGGMFPTLSAMLINRERTPRIEGRGSAIRIRYNLGCDMQGGSGRGGRHDC